MNKYITFIKRFLPVILVLILLLSGGCSRDDHAIPTPPQSGETWVDFSLKVPGIQIPFVQPRSMAGTPEEDIQSIDLIVLEKPDGGGDQYYYREIVKLTKAGNHFTQNGSTVNFKVKLQNRKNNSLIILVVNASVTTSWDNTHSKKDILNALDYAITTSDGKWDIGNNSSDYMPFPMYGEKEVSSISPALVEINDIALTRMVARIDISNEAKNFTLESVSQVNYFTRSKIVPAHDDYGNIVVSPDQPTTDWDPDSTYFKRGWDNRNEYTLNSGETEKIGQIYSFEAKSTDKNRSFLILKGKFGDNLSSSYYRVDFVAQNPTNVAEIETMPIWRNHWYIFTITAVTGDGYATPQEAINSFSVVSNAETLMQVYDYSKLEKIVYDGQYMLGVAEDEITITDFREIPIYTNYPDGWKAEVIEGTEWLFMSKWVETSPGNGDWTKELHPLLEDSGAADDHEYQKIAVKPDPLTTGAERTGTIRLSAGRLSIDIKVTQKAAPSPDLDIVILDENGVELPYDINGEGQKEYKLEFNLHTGEASVPAKRIYVKTTGATGFQLVPRGESNISELAHEHSELIQYPYHNPDLLAIPVERREEWSNGHNYYGEPFKAFNVGPLPGQDNMEYWDFFFFQAFLELDNQWGNIKKVHLKVYQGDWIIVPEFNTNRYLLGSVNYTTEIQANTEWEIAKITETRTSETNPGAVDRFLLANKNDANYLKVGLVGGTNATADERVTTYVNLTTAQWLKGLTGTVTVEFKSRQVGSRPNKSFTFKVFEHHQDYTSASTKTPLFYTFPINLPRTAESYPFVATDWTKANESCQAIGPGWRLPTIPEAFLFSVYRPALNNNNLVVADQDPYMKEYGHKSDTEDWQNGWFFFQYWSLGVRGSNYGTVNPYNGYSWNYNPGLDREPIQNDAGSWLMSRCVYTQWPSNAVNPTFDINKLPNSGQHYPYITTANDDGPIIISRNGNSGANTETVGTPIGIGNIYDAAHNVVAAKLQVANKDINPIQADTLALLTHAEAITLCNNIGWRLPTQKELLLIFAMGGTGFHDESSIPNGFAKLSNGSMGSAYTPLTNKQYNYWTSSYDITAEKAWTMSMLWGSGFTIAPATKGRLNYTTNGETINIVIGGARCVKSVL